MNQNSKKSGPRARRPSFSRRDKENSKVSVTKHEPQTLHQSTITETVFRNPLSDLTGNVAQKSDVSKKPNNTLNEQSLVTAGKKTATQVSKKQKLIDLTKVTEREDYFEDASDEVFVDGQEHFLNFATGIKNPNGFEAKITGNEKGIERVVPVARVLDGGKSNFENAEKKPAQKTTLLRKLSSRRKRAENIFANCLYEDHIKDNFLCIMRTEGEYVFRRSYLERYANVEKRMIVVNWMVYAQQVLNLTEQTLFVAVRMLDKVLILAILEENYYLLAAVICLRITNKVYDHQVLLSSKLYSLCGGKYTRQQINQAEREILSALDFRLLLPEPYTILYYYAKMVGLEVEKVLFNGALFILECLTVSTKFSSTKPSLLAGCAFYLVLINVDHDYSAAIELHVTFIANNLLEKELFLLLANEIDETVKTILKCKVACSEIVEKYSSKKYSKVALRFIASCKSEIREKFGVLNPH